jgi:hypothetical protein
MSSDTLHESINSAVPTLFSLATDLTWNKISNNYKFILSEIQESELNFHEQCLATTIENDKKIPENLDKISAQLKEIYENLHEINLQIYRAKKNLTIIDIRYYPKSSLDKDYRETIKNKQLILHCKVPMPPWLSDKKETFDINWQHYERWNKWKLFLFKLKLRLKIFGINSQ